MYETWQTVSNMYTVHCMTVISEKNLERPQMTERKKYVVQRTRPSENMHISVYHLCILR